MRRGDETNFPNIAPIPGPYERPQIAGPQTGPPELFRIAAFGENRGKGNIVGIQPSFETWMFRTEVDFTTALYQTLHTARNQGFLRENSLVVFPELTALQLLLVEEFPWVTLSRTWSDALRTSLLDEKVWRLVPALLESKKEGWERALYKQVVKDKLERSAEVWVQSFSSAAQEFGVSIFAGTMPLPRNTGVDGGLVLPAGWKSAFDLVMTGILVRPDGTLDPTLARKQKPSGFETKMLWAKESDAAAAQYQTVLGSVKVLLGTDSRQPEAYKLAQGADLILAPSSEWAGESRAAWREEGLNSWIHQTTASAGVTLFNASHLYERRHIGQPMIWKEGQSWFLAEEKAGQSENFVFALWL